MTTPRDLLRETQTNVRSSIGLVTERPQPPPTDDPAVATQSAAQSVRAARASVRNAAVDLLARQPVDSGKDPAAPAEAVTEPDSFTPSMSLADFERQYRPSAAPSPQEPPDRLGSAGREFVGGLAGSLSNLPRAAAMAGAPQAFVFDNLDRIDSGDLYSPGEGLSGILALSLQGELYDRYAKATPEGKAAIRRELEGEVATVRESGLYETGNDIDAWVAENFPRDPRLQDEFWSSKVPSALGSAVGFIVTSLIGRGAGRTVGATGTASTYAAPAMLGSASGQIDQFEAALNAGADIPTALRASRLGASIGLTEAVPIGNLLNRLDKGSGGAIRRYLIRAAKQGTEEGVQEALSGILNAAVAQNLYDPTRGVWTLERGEEAAVGATTGVILETLMSLLPGRARGGAQAAPPPPPAPAPQSQVSPTGTVGGGGGAPLPTPVVPSLPAQAPPAAPSAPSAPARAAKDLRAATRRAQSGETSGVLLTAEELLANDEFTTRTPRGLVRLPNFDEQGGHLLVRADQAADVMRRIEGGEAPAAILPSLTALRDQPSAEPLSDISAQLEDMQKPDSQRTGVYLSADNLTQLTESGQLEAVRSRGVPLENFDGKGGLLIARDQAAADQLTQMRDSGADMQVVLGTATGAGTGKPTAGVAVQRRTPEGAVVQETVATAAEAPVRAAEMQQQSPQDTTVTLPVEEAIARREELIQQETPRAKVPQEPSEEEGLPPLERLPKLPDFDASDVTRSVTAGADAFRGFLGFLAGKVEDQTLSRGLEMARTALGRPDVLEALVEPINEALAVLPDATRRAAVNALRSGDAQLLAAIARGETVAPAGPAAPAQIEAAPAAKPAAQPAAAEALRAATAVPKGKRRPGTLKERAMAVHTAAVVAEKEAKTEGGRLRAAKVKTRLEAILAKSDRAWQKGSATTHKDLDTMGETLRSVVEEKEGVAEAGVTRENAPQRVTESRPEAKPAEKPAPKREPVQGKETIAVKPKIITGRQVGSLLSELGLQGEGRGALEQLRQVVPSLNKETTRVFALVPRFNQKTQTWDDGAIPRKEWMAIMRVVNEFTTAKDITLAQEALIDKLNDVGGKRLDDLTQMEVIELAQRLRELRQARDTTQDIDETLSELDREILAETTQTDPDAEGLLGLEGMNANIAETAESYEIYDTQEKRVVGAPYQGANALSRARGRADRLDNEYGGYRYTVRSRKSREFHGPSYPGAANLTPEQQRTVDEGMERGEEIELPSTLPEEQAALGPRALVEIVGYRLHDPVELAMLSKVATEAGIREALADAWARGSNAAMTFAELAPKLVAALDAIGIRKPELRARAARVAAIVRALNKLSPETPISLLPRSEGPFGYASSVTTGTVDFGTTIGLTSKDRAAQDLGAGAALFTILHEQAHHATMALMTLNPEAPEVVRLTALAKKVYELYLENAYRPLWNHNAWVGLKNGKGDAREFVVEVMTNPTFLLELAHMSPYYRAKTKDTRTILDRFVEIITKLLGLDDGHTGLVAEVTNAAWSVAVAQRRSARHQAFLAEQLALSRRAGALTANLSAAARRTAVIAGPATANLVTEFERTPVARLGNRMWGQAKEWFLALHTMDQLEDRHAVAFQEGDSNPLKDIAQLDRKRRSIATRFQEQGEKEWAKEWTRLGAAENKVLGEVARNITLWQIDPRKSRDAQVAEAKNRTTFDDDYVKIKAAWRALPDSSRSLISRALDYFQRLRADARLAAIDLAFDTYEQYGKNKVPPSRRRLVYSARGVQVLDDLIGDGKAIDLGDATINSELIRSLGRVLRITDLAGPYLPLRRYGDFVVTVEEGVDERFDTLGEAEAALESLLSEAPANEGALVGEGDKWRLVGSRQELALYPSRAEADAAKADLERRGVKARVGKKLDATSPGTEGALATLLSSIQRRLPGNAQAKAMLENAFLELMADRAVHSAKLQRAGFAGVRGEDMRRAAAERAVGASWNIADLRTVFEESSILTRLRQAVTAPGVSDDLRVRRGEVANEVTRQRASNIAGRFANVFERVAGTVGMLKFLLDPAYAAVNASQTALVAYPVLAARFGQGRTVSALGRAYRALTGPIMRGTLAAHTQLGATRYDILQATMEAIKKNPRFAKYLPQLQELIDSNTIDATFAQEMAALSRGSASGTQWQLALEYTKLLPQGAEYLNRFVTALALLELTNGNVDQTRALVSKTQFNYSTENRPRAFRFPGSRAILMFKMYSQGIINILVSSTYDSMTKAGVERAQALKTLGGVVAMHSMAAGVLGGVMLEPLRAIVWAVAHATADDDEQVPPVDTLVSMWLAEMFGEKAGRVVARGLPAAIGMDLVNRVGLHNLILFDKENSPLSPEGLVSLLGPMPRVGFDLQRGVKHASEGRWDMAAAAVLPKFFADWARAYTLLNRGVTTAGGDTRVKPGELTAWDVTQQALGFRPAVETEDVERRLAEVRRQEFLSERKQSIYRRYRQASPGERKELMAEVQAFNRANPSSPIRFEDLLRAVTGYQENVQRSRRGLYEDPELREQLGRP